MADSDVVEALKPNHLADEIPESTEELKAEVEKAGKLTPEKPKFDEDDPRAQREYSFEFNWVDGRGKAWSGSFINKILSIRDRQLVGVMRARLAAGMPVESLDTYTAEINLMIAHMTFSLTEQPSWAADLRSLDNVELLQALYTEVLGHEATFHGSGTSEDAS